MKRRSLKLKLSNPLKFEIRLGCKIPVAMPICRYQF
jgi:hypothetical protein